MTRDEMIDRLVVSEETLAGVLERIKPDARECASCGHTRYDDFNLKQAADALQGAVTRVEKARRHIEYSDPAPRAPKKDQP